MKLAKGEEIYVNNWIMKSHSEAPNSGFVVSEFKGKPEAKTVEYPGAWFVVAPASVATDNEICHCCKRIYSFNNPRARAQCECRGEEVR